MPHSLRHVASLTGTACFTALCIWSLHGAFDALKISEIAGPWSKFTWQYTAENRFLDAFGYLALGLVSFLLGRANAMARVVGLALLPVACLLSIASSARTFDREHLCSLSSGIWESTALVCNEEVVFSQSLEPDSSFNGKPLRGAH